MSLSELPVEIQIKIYRNLNVREIRNLAITCPIIFNLIKSFFLDKEKWIYLNTLKNVNDIEKLINCGYRYIHLNKRIEVIYNYSYSIDNREISQIITDKDLYGVNFNYFTCHPYSKSHLIFPNGRNYESCETKILVDAPYQFKRRGIIR